MSTARPRAPSRMCPFGGMKGSSSWSREQGKSAADFFTQTRTVYVEGLPCPGPVRPMMPHHVRPDDDARTRSHHAAGPLAGRLLRPRRSAGGHRADLDGRQGGAVRALRRRRSTSLTMSAVFGTSEVAGRGLLHAPDGAAGSEIERIRRGVPGPGERRCSRRRDPRPAGCDGAAAHLCAAGCPSPSPRTRGARWRTWSWSAAGLAGMFDAIATSDESDAQAGAGPVPAGLPATGGRPGSRGGPRGFPDRGPRRQGGGAPLHRACPPIRDSTSVTRTSIVSSLLELIDTEVDAMTAESAHLRAGPDTASRLPTGSASRVADRAHRQPAVHVGPRPGDSSRRLDAVGQGRHAT